MLKTSRPFITIRQQVQLLIALAYLTFLFSSPLPGVWAQELTPEKKTLSTNEPELAPGKPIEIRFSHDALPDMVKNMTGLVNEDPCLAVRLPDDYDEKRSFPLLVYLPGMDGGSSGDLKSAVEIAGKRGWIVASLPLFKNSIDPSEPYKGILVGFGDYSALSQAYEVMLGELFKRIPNIDSAKSTAVGFSNGAFALAVLVSCQDALFMKRFETYCFVEQGMFHLTDLHKNILKTKKFLFLVGEKNAGADLKLRQAQLLLEMAGILGLDLQCNIMKKTGHEFPDRYKKLMGRWLSNESIKDPGWKLIKPVRPAR